MSLRALVYVLGLTVAGPALAVDAEAKAELERISACQKAQDHACLFAVAEDISADEGFAANCRADLQAMGCQQALMSLMFEGLSLVEDTDAPAAHLEITERFFVASERLLPNVRDGVSPFHLVAGEACLALDDSACVAANAPFVQVLTTREGRNYFAYRVLRERSADVETRLATFLSNAEEHTQ